MIPAPASSHANTAGNAELAAQLDAVVAELDLPQPDVAPGVGRRRRHPRTRDRLQRVMTIVERGGILFVEEGLPHPQLGMPARRRARARALGGEIVHEKTLRELEGNEIIRVLEAADRKLTPHFGLRELKDGVLHPEARPRDDGRILLMVHGTFSNNDNLLGEIGAAPDGHSFLRTVVGAYDQVLAFDHKTLSISPMLNARHRAPHQLFPAT